MKSLATILVALAAAACSNANDGAADAPAHPRDASPDGTASDADQAVLAALHLNEVSPANKTGCADEGGLFPDFVELYNSGAADLDLGGMTMTDDLTMPAKVALPAGLVVPAHGYKLLYCDDAAAPGPDHLNLKLSAGGEAVGLYLPDGTLVDSTTWGATADDGTYARIPDGTGAFQACMASTCSATNGTACPTMTSSAALTINEVNPSNLTTCGDEGGDTTKDWFEIYNAGGTDADFGGYFVTDDLTMPMKVALPAGLVVPAHGTLVLYADQVAGMARHVNFKLSKGGEAVALSAPDGTLIDSFSWASAIPDDHSYARFPDGTGAFVACSVASCGASNGAACAGTTPRAR